MDVQRGQHWAALGVVLALLAITVVRYGPPAALAEDAPAHRFSGGRAKGELARLLGEAAPHPTGSVEADRVRDRIVARLRELGLSPELQDTWICSSIYSCARVQNILALIPGTEPSWPLVLVSSHYDSVAAGPGASDDGSGVAATLELARAYLRPEDRTAPRADVLLFINDGEEGGLKGAEAFVAEHPLATRVGAVVNMEARGTTGPSLMFETSDENGRLIALFARAVERPATNSIYYTVYKLLPNDTDLTVYKRAGLRGLNFAFVGNEVHYHTPLDDLAHTDVRSLQHQGENALAMVRALSAQELSTLAADDVVFFDLLTLTTVFFSESAMRVIAWTALLLVLGGILALARTGRLTAAAVGWGAASFVAALLVTALAAGLTQGLLYLLGAFRYAFLAYPSPSRIALAVTAVAGVLAGANLFTRRLGGAGLWAGGALAFAVIGVAASQAAPGLAYPFALPALVSGLVMVAMGLLRREGRVLSWLPALLMGCALWLPVAWLLYDGIGVFGLGVTALVLVFPLWTAAPAFAGVSGRLWLGVAVLWGAGALAAVLVPDFTPEHPQKLNLEYQALVDASGARSSQWVATPMSGDLPSDLLSVAPFSEDRTQPLPWPILIDAHVAPAPELPVEPPAFEAAEVAVVDGNLRVRGRLRSPRGAHEAGLVVPEDRLLSAAMNGKRAPAERSKNLVRKLLAADGWLNLACHTTGAEGVELEFELRGAEPATVHVWDTTTGLPEQGASLLRARPAMATPYQAGDRTLSARTLMLRP